MEINRFSVVGIIILLISVASAGIPTFNHLFLYIIYWFGVGAFIITGILCTYGGVNYKKNLMDIGLIIGLIGWTLLIITNIFGIFWNQTTMGEEIFVFLRDNIFLLHLLEDNFEVFFLISSITSGYVAFHRFGFISSIIHLILAVVGLILGLILITLIKKWDKW